MLGRLYTNTGLRRLLSDIQARNDDFLSVYVTPTSFPDYLFTLSNDDHSASLAEIIEVVKTEKVRQGVKNYGTGAAIFWSGSRKHIVLPPFPVKENHVSRGKPEASSLRQLVDGKYLIGVVMVTWGWYALGIFDNGKPIECKVGTGYIHKKHKKGGRSQKRFARRTEEQKKDFLRRIGNRIEERFGNYLPDVIFFGGNRLILKPLVQETRYLQARIDKISPRVINVRHADRDALMGSPAEINKSMVFTF